MIIKKYQVKVDIERSWYSLLKNEFEKKYFQELVLFVKHEYKAKQICPSPNEIFKAFELSPVPRTKVVILGQDPYHTPGVANGLAFSADPTASIPPSLKNIFTELHTDLLIKKPSIPDLAPWAEQGILLMNATLTVRAGQAGSHQKKGWEEFTDAVIHKISQTQEQIVFILWGSYAKSKVGLIDTKKHKIISSVHPSPLSAHRGFFGSKPFSQANEYLVKHKKEPIQWQLP